ncbi:mitochondrial folate transporter/carrier isoform X2 [Oncorhynchus kisutch]|uniref:mitochondrial folate transporter/carrier isoform X2 n=1 Tax=Oncorhynchus kisutch TaxID=8019 RepID=UPI00099FB111|nr:mitochondrial folate transporter/carrier isoform X2 [Oncorhynchus kisutch]
MTEFEKEAEVPAWNSGLDDRFLRRSSFFRVPSCHERTEVGSLRFPGWLLFEHCIVRKLETREKRGQIMKSVIFCYNAIKAYTKEGRQSELSATEHLLSAAQAGVLTLTLTNPIWVTKTRLVLQYNADPTRKQYKGMMDALVKIYRHEGIPGLYRGYVPGLFGTSHGALQFMAYEELKRDYNKYKKMPSEAKLNPLEYITMAALSKIFAVATTYPYQVVRARLQDQHNKYNGVLDVVRRTWRNEGAVGFYKGMVPNLIRVTPACCITFVVYENVSRFLMGQK